jgi:hypothetical protein
VSRGLKQFPSVAGWIKRGKDPEQIDRKLIEKHEIAISGV